MRDLSILRYMFPEKPDQTSRSECTAFLRFAVQCSDEFWVANRLDFKLKRLLLRKEATLGFVLPVRKGQNCNSKGGTRKNIFSHGGNKGDKVKRFRIALAWCRGPLQILGAY